MKAQIDSVKDFLGLPRTSMTSHAYVRKLNFDMTTDEIRLEGGSLTELTDKFSVLDSRLYELWNEFCAEHHLRDTLTREQFDKVLDNELNIFLVPSRDGTKRWFGFTEE